MLEDEIRALGPDYECFGMPFWYVFIWYTNNPKYVHKYINISTHP